MESLTITYASLLEQGDREYNEDSLGVVSKDDQKAFILCDGLGGHGNGDVASGLVVERMKELLSEDNTIEDSILKAQEDLLAKQKEMDAETSMKTTIVCLSIKEGKAKVVHVGDSRFYHFENNKLIQQTKDHSVPQMLVNRGMIREKDIRHHEDRSRLLRVMGTEWDSPKYQVMEEFDVTPEDSFLLCSDGFWEMIEEKDMIKKLKTSKSPEEWLEKMKKTVLKHGKRVNMDNYSAITVFCR